MDLQSFIPYKLNSLWFLLQFTFEVVPSLLNAAGVDDNDDDDDDDDDDDGDDDDDF